MAKKIILKKVLASKTLSYLLALLLLFGLVALGREINRRVILRKQLSRIEAQVQDKEHKNEELLDKIGQMETDYFKEKAARLKLGLQKPGERVIVIVPFEGKDNQTESRIKAFGRKISNFKGWWNYFFK